MINKIELEGKILGWISQVSGQDRAESDFIIEADGSRFQVVCDSRIANGYGDDDKVTIIGKACENGGDVYFRAHEIIPDPQKRLGL